MVYGVRPLAAMPDHHVALRWLALGHVGAAAFARIFVRFNCVLERPHASGNHELYRLRIGVKSRWTFRGIQRAQSATRSRAHIDEASTLGEGVGNGVDRLRNMRQTPS